MSTPFVILPLVVTLLAQSISVGNDSQTPTTVYYDPNEVRPYVSHLQDHALSPVEYLLTLFQRHDLVILAERTHPETTQWDFIRELTADPRFIARVGHVFTEYGSVSQQPSLDDLMATSNLHGDKVERDVITILRNFPIHPYGWHNNNFFDYLRSVYELNHTLAVDQRIKLYFSDVPWQWDGKTRRDYDLFLKTQLCNRDEIIANNIISKFRDILGSNSKRKKALVVLNTRHAFRTGGNSAADYLFREYPTITANVMLNTKAAHFTGVDEHSVTYVLIHNGKWDAAFCILGNPPLGFDFADSPFGKDRFDLHSGFARFTDLTYARVFTGMVFYQPLESHMVASDIPGYYDEEFCQTVLRRAKLMGNEDYERIAGFLEAAKTRSDVLMKRKERGGQRLWPKLEFKVDSRSVERGVRPRDEQAPVDSSQPLNVDAALEAPLPSGKQIVERSIQQSGGREALAKIESRLVKGSILFTPPGIKATLTAYQVRPNKYYAKMITEMDATVVTTQLGADGEVAWELNSLTGPRILEGQERSLLLQQSSFDETGYQQLYSDVQCVGTESVEGEVCYKVIQTAKEGKPSTAYYSRESGLLAKWSLETVESLQRDYRKVDEVLYPHHFIQKATDIEMHLRVESIEHNVAIPEGRFDLPETVKKILEQVKNGKQAAKDD